MKIEQKINGNRGRFFYQENDQELAVLKYKIMPDDEAINILSVHVDPSLGGKGVGKQLVTAAVEFARKENYKIIPTCPFAVTLFDKITEWEDLKCL